MILKSKIINLLINSIRKPGKKGSQKKENTFDANLLEQLSKKLDENNADKDKDKRDESFMETEPKEEVVEKKVYEVKFQKHINDDEKKYNEQQRKQYIRAKDLQKIDYNSTVERQKIAAGKMRSYSDLLYNYMKTM